TLGETTLELTGALGAFNARLPVATGLADVARGESRRTRLAADAVSRLHGMLVRYGASFESQTQQYAALRILPGEKWQEIGRAGEGSEAGLYLDVGAQL